MLKVKYTLIRMTILAFKSTLLSLLNPKTYHRHVNSSLKKKELVKGA